MTSSRKVGLLICLVLLVGLSACAPAIQPDPTNPIRTVAILPVYNATVSVRGPELVREFMAENMTKYHYEVRPKEEVDQVLRDRMGITLGAHLDMVEPSQVAETLGVDGLVYGYLLDFDSTTLGVYNSNMVRGGFKLIDTNTGEVIWSMGAGIKRVVSDKDLGALAQRKADLSGFQTIQGIKDIPGMDKWTIVREGTSNVLANAVWGVGGRVLKGVAGTQLKRESKMLIKQIFKDLPMRPGPYVAPKKGEKKAEEAPAPVPQDDGGDPKQAPPGGEPQSQQP